MEAPTEGISAADAPSTARKINFSITVPTTITTATDVAIINDSASIIVVNEETLMPENSQQGIGCNKDSSKEKNNGKQISFRISEGIADVDSSSTLTFVVK